MEKGIIKCWKGDAVRCTGNEVKRIMNKLRAVLRNLSRRGFWQSKALSNVAWQGCAFTCHWLREMFKKSPAKLHLIFFVCSGCMLHGESEPLPYKAIYKMLFFCLRGRWVGRICALFHSCSWRVGVRHKYFNTLNGSSYMVRQYRRKLNHD